MAPRVQVDVEVEQVPSGLMTEVTVAGPDTEYVRLVLVAATFPLLTSETVMVKGVPAPGYGDAEAVATRSGSGANTVRVAGVLVLVAASAATTLKL
jgi:hypothetical protein